MDFLTEFKNGTYTVHTGGEHAMEFADWCTRNGLRIENHWFGKLNELDDVGFNYNSLVDAVYCEYASFYLSHFTASQFISWEEFLELSGAHSEPDVDINSLLAVLGGEGNAC